MQNIKKEKKIDIWLKNLKAVYETLNGDKGAPGLTISQGKWISLQRARLKKGELSSFQQKEFAKLAGKLKVYDELAAAKRKLKLEKQWHEKAEWIIVFKEKNERWPSVTAAEKRERSLGVLKSKLCVLHQAGKLPDALVQYLQTNNFYFDKSELWKLKLKELKKYTEEHRCLPPQANPLYSWLKRVLNNYHELDPQKIRSLNKISLSSLPSAAGKKLEDSDERDFRIIQNFFHKYGKLPTRKEDKELCNRVAELRRRLKAGRMSEATLKRFQESGIDLLAGTFTIGPWEDRLEDLRIFLKRNEYRRPSLFSNDEKERKLYGWCQTQKNSYKKGKLSAGQIKLLHELKFSTGSKKLIN